MDESDVLREYLRNEREGQALLITQCKPSAFTAGDWGLGARSTDETNALITVGASPMGTF